MKKCQHWLHAFWAELWLSSPNLSQKDINSHSYFKLADELAIKLRELMVLCRKNLQHAQEFQKQYQNKYAKSRSYTPNKKVGLNSKYIKTKQNCKLETKIFRSFRVLHLVRKQAYKWKLPKKWKIYDVFHVSLLEQDTTKSKQVDKIFQIELDKGNSEEYKIKAISNSKIYTKKSDNSHHLSALYHLVLWKGYLEEKNT